MNIQRYLASRKTAFEKVLSGYFKNRPPFPRNIYAAVNYSLMAGGKRLRPILGIAVCDIFRKPFRGYLPFACAIEMIHTYSLIHDDLPDMDNDDRRRGKPTLHKKYDPATAILAGDALLTYAFQLMSTPRTIISAQQQLRMIHLISDAAGIDGMVGGQVEDMLCENKKISVNRLKKIHAAKTGRMITASLLCGAVFCNITEKNVNHLKNYGEKIGLAFQIADDVLDVTGTHALGKGLKKDLAQNKATYVTLYSVDKAKKMAETEIAEAKASLARITEDTTILDALADFIIQRVT